MFPKKILIPVLVVVISASLGFYAISKKQTGQKKAQFLTDNINPQEDQGGLIEDSYPLSIESLRACRYPGSDIVIEEKLEPGSNYDRYIASYRSEGLKIYALLTVPIGTNPPAGWPVIIFNHGYISPA